MKKVEGPRLLPHHQAPHAVAHAGLAAGISHDQTQDDHREDQRHGVGDHHGPAADIEAVEQPQRDARAEQGVHGQAQAVRAARPHAAERLGEKGHGGQGRGEVANELDGSHGADYTPAGRVRAGPRVRESYAELLAFVAEQSRVCAKTAAKARRLCMGVSNPYQ